MVTVWLPSEAFPLEGSKASHSGAPETVQSRDAVSVTVWEEAPAWKETEDGVTWRSGTPIVSSGSQAAKARTAAAAAKNKCLSFIVSKVLC